MRLLKVAGAALNQTPLAWERNKNNIINAIDTAKADKVSILCLPELCITGYGCEDVFNSPGLIETGYAVLEEITPHTKDIIVAIGMPVFYNNAVFNTACVLNNGKIAGFVAKKYLAGDGIHYEPRWFKSWPAGVVADLTLNRDAYPLGDLVFDISGIRIGFEICEDAWVASRPGNDLSNYGVDIILNPSASHFAFGKHEIRKRFVLEGSRAFNVTYIYANLMGCEAGRIIYEGGTLIASDGKMLAEGKRLSYQDFLISSVVVDVAETRMNRSRVASFQPLINDTSHRVVTDQFPFQDIEPEISQKISDNKLWEDSSNAKKEEFTRVVTLGLFDYLRKSQANGFVVSLSGGADSSAVSCLIRLMATLAIQDLGTAGFADKLAHIPEIAGLKDEKEITERLLTCVYQATENSSQTTEIAAREIAAALGAKFYLFDVNPFYRQYVKLIEHALNEKLNWETDDISLQNIQARVRAPGIWLLANKLRALLLTTSNRSEAAVGYATMDGDTCGGLCPIGGIDKAFLKEWLVWLEKEGPKGTYNIPQLIVVNKQQPTAELKPQDSSQTDEKDLMPYSLLNSIEALSIRDKKTPLEIYRILSCQYKEYRKKDLLLWIERFFKLWCRNQWKRERYAPSFHLDDENLDPKTWCRFPILSGNYERELAALKKYAEGEVAGK